MDALRIASRRPGLAGSPVQLVAARLLQGLAAAMMVPQILALIVSRHAPAARPKALAWFMAYFSSSIFVISLLLLQNGLGLSPLQAGLAFAPMALAGIVVVTDGPSRRGSPPGRSTPPSSSPGPPDWRCSVPSSSVRSATILPVRGTTRRRPRSSPGSVSRWSS
ncbi:MAG: hypothetical protein HOV67_13885 [Kribbellaceae bacterium]|nr:hypothetical protein [Kribbellaceae bacterium]